MALTESIHPSDFLPTEDGASAATVLPFDRQISTQEVETATFGLG